MSTVLVAFGPGRNILREDGKHYVSFLETHEFSVDKLKAEVSRSVIKKKLGMGKSFLMKI